jgi:peptidoglycan/LPS O-acetylase OafA/YrhL
LTPHLGDKFTHSRLSTPFPTPARIKTTYFIHQHILLLDPHLQHSVTNQPTPSFSIQNRDFITMTHSQASEQQLQTPTSSPTSPTPPPDELTSAPQPKQSRQIFPVLDGLRVVLTLWVVLFHTAWHLAMFLPEKAFINDFESLSEVVTSGLNGVDWFFVLTGFLLAQPIFAGQRTGGWFNFVWMRITRLYPMYLVSICIFCGVMSQMGSVPYVDWDQHLCHVLRPLVDQGLIEQGLPPSTGTPHNCHLSWINFLFLNNFIPFGGCMGWTWSLCVQVHFILIFPLLLKWFGTGKKFLGWCAFMTGVWVVFRYLLLTMLIQKYEVDPPPLYIYQESYIEQFFVLFNVWYSSTPQRIGCVFGGAILAWIQVNQPKFITKLHKPYFTWPLTFLAAYCITLATDVYFAHTWRTLFFAVGGPGHVVAIATIIYLLINKLGPLAYLDRPLSSRIMKALAYPSYGVYLVHSFIVVWLYRGPYLKPHVTLDYPKLLLSYAAVLVLSYSISYLATRFVEEPIKIFLRNYVDPAPSSKKQD